MLHHLGRLIGGVGSAKVGFEADESESERNVKPRTLALGSGDTVISAEEHPLSASHGGGGTPRDTGAAALLIQAPDMQFPPAAVAAGIPPLPNEVAAVAIDAAVIPPKAHTSYSLFDAVAKGEAQIFHLVDLLCGSIQGLEEGFKVVASRCGDHILAACHLESHVANPPEHKVMAMGDGIKESIEAKQIGGDAAVQARQVKLAAFKAREGGAFCGTRLCFSSAIQAELRTSDIDARKTALPNLIAAAHRDGGGVVYTLGVSGSYGGITEAWAADASFMQDLVTVHAEAIIQSGVVGLVEAVAGSTQEMHDLAAGINSYLTAKGTALPQAMER